MICNVFTQDISATLDYRFEWSDWLESGETITSMTVTVPAGITRAKPDEPGIDSVTVWLTGGTAGLVYAVSCTITSSAGRTDVRYIYLFVTAPSLIGASALLAQANTTRNGLSLEEWRHHFGYHPLHFWGMAGAIARVTSSCNAVVRQYAWQAADAVGREEIRAAIQTAEARLAEHLGFAVAPHFVTETHEIPRMHDTRLQRAGYAGADGRWISIQLDEGFVQAVGPERLELVSVSHIDYTDEDGDGYKETFTATAATTITDPEQIAVYIATADRPGGVGVSEAWRVAPLSITIRDGIATIRGRAWLLVRPVLYEGFSAQDIDPSVIGNYVTQIEVYRRYAYAGTTLDTAQAVLVWESRPAPGWACTSTDAGNLRYAIARVGIRDAELGIVTIGEAVYNPTTDTWSSPESCWYAPPDRVIVRYLAGVPRENGQVAGHLRPIIANFAAAQLARPICACDVANRQLYEQQFDLSRAAGMNDEQYATSADVLSNPFGARRGAVNAWRWLQNQRIVTGFVP